jgi:hypothetical protein
MLTKIKKYHSTVLAILYLIITFYVNARNLKVACVQYVPEKEKY